MSDALVNHHANQQIEWNKTVDIQRLINVMPFTHLNNLNRWVGLRTTEQFNSLAEHSSPNACAPMLHIRSSSAHQIDASPNLDLPVLDDLTLDQPECPSDMDAHHMPMVQSNPPFTLKAVWTNQLPIQQNC